MIASTNKEAFDLPVFPVVKSTNGWKFVKKEGSGTTIVFRAKGILVAKVSNLVSLPSFIHCLLKDLFQFLSLGVASGGCYLDTC